MQNPEAFKWRGWVFDAIRYYDFRQNRVLYRVSYTLGSEIWASVVERFDDIGEACKHLQKACGRAAPKDFTIRNLA